MAAQEAFGLWQPRCFTSRGDEGGISLGVRSGACDEGDGKEGGRRGLVDR